MPRTSDHPRTLFSLVLARIRVTSSVSVGSWTSTGLDMRVIVKVTIPTYRNDGQINLGTQLIASRE